MNTSAGAKTTQPTYFQIQAGKLDEQVKAFIAANDRDGDNALSLDEALKAGGLTGSVKFKVNHSSMTQSLWAAITGPSNTLNAKEYAQYLITLDANQDTQITQDEMNGVFSRWTKIITNTPKTALKSIYQELVRTGQQFGIESIFDNAEEEALAFGTTLTKSTLPAVLKKPVLSSSASMSSQNVGMPTFKPLALMPPSGDTVSPFLINVGIPMNLTPTTANTDMQGPRITLQDIKKTYDVKNKPYINAAILESMATQYDQATTSPSLFDMYGQYMAPSRYAKTTIVPSGSRLPIVGQSSPTGLSLPSRRDASGLPLV